MEIGQDGITTKQADYKGVVLQRLGQNPGKIAWGLEIFEDRIAVTCGQYTRWKEVLPEALNLLGQGFKFLDLSTLSINAIGCQVVDKFIYSGHPGEYSLEDVFSINSKFLTENTRNSGELWHVFQGWFDHSDDSKYLNQLNISSTLQNANLVAVIDHSVHQALKDPLSALELLPLGNSANRLRDFFNSAHQKNKAILNSLLSSAKKKEIGLNDE